jgi:hypothetical protein
MKVLLEVDKNKPLGKNNFNTKIYNFVLYYKDLCWFLNFTNENYTISPTTKYLKMLIAKYQQIGLHNHPNEIINCMYNLPNDIEKIKITFLNEYHDNYISLEDSNDYIFDMNLPHCLKKLSLIRAGAEMIEKNKRIPFGCKLKIEKYDKENPAY